MVTDSERREVAARLRILATHREVDKGFVEDALGLYMGECVDGYDPVSVNELADLIDPETSNDRLEDRLISPIASPTCHIKVNGNQDVGEPPYFCDRCGVYLSEIYMYTWTGACRMFERCPNCGAKVVQDGR